MSRLPLVSLACLALLPAACKDTGGRTANEDAGSPSRPAAAGDDGSPTELADTCDPEKLAALTKALEAAEPGAGPELVARQLGGACKLPRAIASFFAVSGFADSDSREVAAAATAVKDASEALTKICPNAAGIREQLAAEPGDQRTGKLYERCDFKRFGLVDKSTWVAGEPSSPVPFFAYHWLVEQGVRKADARALANSMILRDRKRWGLRDQKLPTIAQPLARIPDGTQVYVSPSHIRVNDQNIVALAEGRLDPAAVQGHLIGPLFDVLAEEAEKAKQLSEATSAEWPGVIVLVADAETPQRVLIDILYSAGKAEFRTYAFVGQSAPFEYGAVLVDPPKFSIKPQPDKAPEYGVRIATDGFRVRGSTPGETSTHIPLAENGELDFAALTAAAKAFKKAHPKATVAHVQAEEATRFERFAKTLATLSGAQCQTRKSACLLPGLVVEAGGTRPFDAEIAARSAGILGIEPADPSALPFGVEGTGRGGGSGEGTIGLGNMALIGKGDGSGTGSGYGRGSGAGFGGRGRRGPRVQHRPATVTGGLDKNIIRRIVRAHGNEVRACYTKGLATEPTLSGGVTIGFTISAAGKVTAARVNKDTLSDKDVGKCIGKAFEDWSFPKPSEGTVDVVYPFVLEPG